MTKVPPVSFSPELLTLMRSALDTAVHQIDRSHRTPATTSKDVGAAGSSGTASEGASADFARADECCEWTEGEDCQRRDHETGGRTPRLAQGPASVASWR